MIIYQVLARLWRSGKMSAFDAASFEHLRSLGVSHVWYTGIIRHSAGKPYVKGDIGSPYSIADYYDVNPYLADNESERMSEFEDLVKRTHAAGMKVLLDFVPNHVSPDYSDSHGGLKTLHRCDYDWTDTDKIDYACRENWERMSDIIAFWVSKGVDGFRCDMAELVPVEFWRYLILAAKATKPDLVFIAEVYQTSRYESFIESACFDYLYDKSGMYDTLRGVIDGSRQAWDITGVWQRLGNLQPHMLNFLENHDEHRIASPWFAGSVGRSMCALGVSALFYPIPFMLYFGQEVGESAFDGHEGRTSIFSEQRHIDPVGAVSPVLDRYRRVMKLREEFSDAANWDLCYAQKGSLGFDMRKHFAFMRHRGDKAFVVVANFSGAAAKMTLSIPHEAPLMKDEAIELQIEPWDFKIIANFVI